MYIHVCMFDVLLSVCVTEVASGRLVSTHLQLKTPPHPHRSKHLLRPRAGVIGAGWGA